MIVNILSILLDSALIWPSRQHLEHSQKPCLATFSLFSIPESTDDLMFFYKNITRLHLVVFILILNWLQTATTTKKNVFKNNHRKIELFFFNNNTLCRSVVFHLRTFKHFSNVDSSSHGTLRWLDDIAASIQFQRIHCVLRHVDSVFFFFCFFPVFLPFWSLFFPSLSLSSFCCCC